ncbi:hypothetical protein Tco_1422007 [Tanacetum coccineum]
MLTTHMSLVSLMQVFQDDDSCGRPELGEVYLLYIHGRVTRKYISVGVGCDQQLPLGHPRCVLRRNGSYSTARVFSELRHLPNDEFMNQYNINMARQVVMGSQLRLRFEQEAKLLKMYVAQVARWDQKIEAKENNQQLSQQVSSLQVQITGEEKIKATFKEFKKYEDDRVKHHCAEMDARLDKLSMDFDEELYPHMLTAIAGHCWVIGNGLRLAIMKCGETPELR